MEILRFLIRTVFPFCFILRVDGRESTKMPGCQVDEFFQQIKNTSEYQCVPCRECPNGYWEMSSCRINQDTQCEKCMRGTFYRQTGWEKMCRKCRKCVQLSDLKCDNSTVHTCPDGCSKAGRRCKACSFCSKKKIMKTECSSIKDTLCKSCKKCSLKPSVLKKCSRLRHPKCTQCKRCVKGKTFIYKKCSRSKDTHCKPCSQCAPGFYIKRKCSLRHNTRCAPCPIGKEDVMCNRCPRGTHMSPTNSSVCVPCPQGTFMDKNNHALTFCKPCRRCRVHEQIAHACTVIADTRCGPCSPGFFRLPSTHSCAMCSVCSDNRTGLVVDECLRQSDNTSRACWPPVPSEDPPALHQRKSKPDEGLNDLQSKDDLEGNNDLEGNDDLQRSGTYTAIPVRLSSDSGTVLMVLLIVSLTIITVWSILVFLKRVMKRKAIGLIERNRKTGEVSMPSLFSTNSITDYFDLNLLYKRQHPKYSSDPDFYKWDIRSCCGSGHKDRPPCTLNSKSRSLGTVNTVELEFWNDRSLFRNIK